MRRFSVLSLLSHFIPVMGTAAIPIPEETAAYIRARVDSGRDVGIVAGVATEKGSAIIAHGNSVPGVPLKSDAILEIGSVSKVFTATVLADMVAKGEVGLDDPAEKYMPDGAKLPERAGKKITLRQLASHTSGLPRMPHNLAPADPTDPYADYTGELLLEALATCELESDPGTKYAYSNLGCGLLGYLLARHAGKSWEQLVQERISGPMGLKDTTVTLTPEQQARFSPGHAGGAVVAPWHFDALAGAGALRGTVADLLRFSGTHAGMLYSPLLSTLETTHEPIAAAGSANTKIALGWHVTTTKSGATLIWHNGATGGYTSFTGFVKGGKRVVAVMSNTSAEVDVLGMHLLDPTIELPKISKRAEVVVSPDKLQRLVGQYTAAPGQVFDVREKDGKLSVQLTGQPPIDVYPESETKFFPKVIDAQIVFEMGPEDRATKLTLHQGGMVMPAPRTSDTPSASPLSRAEVTVAPEKLKLLEGKYTLAPGQIFDVREKAGKLTVQLTNQPRLDVYAESETKFFYKAVDAQLVFEVGTDGRASKVTLYQNGMVLPAPRVE